MISAKLGERLKNYAQLHYPKECCGLVVGDLFVPITNISAQPESGFIFCPVQLSDALEEHQPTAIFHSHPDDTAAPSEHDLARINRADTPLPWVIVSVPELEISITHPAGQPPLIGRKFVHGVNDCYTLIRDFYASKLGVALADYHREDEWWAKGQDLYLDNYEAEGFYEVSEGEMVYGDFILMQVESDKTNHAGIYIGDGWFLHHLYGHLSRRGIYGGYWQDRTRRILRHKDYDINKVLQLEESDDAAYGH